METTAAAAWSWLTLFARRPSSSTETKPLPYSDTSCSPSLPQLRPSILYTGRSEITGPKGGAERHGDT
ncbi:hypothetical protein AMECASPLE_011491 [Ameca splendens]|uniref:Secreted protein n=1 Tax=Ameca splendens TaxID=208324 RepID=A0ABV0YBY6_9TELE